MTKGSGWKRIAAAMMSGLLVAGAFPPLDVTLLAWIGMMPLLWALWSIEATICVIAFAGTALALAL